MPMERELIFATHNEHKAEEVSAILACSGAEVVVRTLSSMGDNKELAEDGDTLVANALQKAEQVWERYGKDCFADDTGLEVEALGGAPGVYSARYAGPACIAADNMRKLLGALQGVENRRARFRTVIVLIIGGERYTFEGSVDGTIIDAPHGVKGFGYDPIFLPDGYEQTFAEMSEEQKNSISHRYRATEKMAQFLKELEG